MSRALNRRLERIAADLEARTERESWRASPEREREIQLGYSYGFLQRAFCAGGFEDLGRRWAQMADGGRFKSESEKLRTLQALYYQIASWARRFKATREEYTAALEAAKRGLENPFTEEEWSNLNRGGGYGLRGSLDTFLQTGSPRWEISVALWFARVNPNSRHYPAGHVANPLRQDIEAIDKHFNGPRTRRKKAERERLSRELVGS